MDLKLTEGEFIDKRKNAFSNNEEVVYVISCYNDKQSAKKRSIGRVLGNDGDGILYIGRASSENRLVALLRSIRDGNDGKNHSFGNRYKDNKHFRSQFPLDLLSIRLISTANSKVLETRKLREYVEVFGELPPLNHCR